ncbi:MAG: ABC transporter permease [Spirochaetaceae bacterium]|nr:MAG: ABC transporter permease [Spirochaetaceae bacterium]
MLTVKQVFRTKNLYILVGSILVLASVFTALAAPLLTPFSPTAMAPRDRLLAPSKAHPFGTDEFGRDVLSRIVFGMRNSLQVSVAVVLLTTVVGLIVGLIAGFYPKIDIIISRVLDAMMAFPEIIIAITLAAVFGAGKFNIILSMSFAYSSRMARVARASTISVKELEYVESAKAAGASNPYILINYILPNILSPIIVQATFVFAFAIIVEATLSFLGVGIRPPAPSLGGILSDGRNLMAVAPWIVLFPGFTIVLAALGFNLQGDGLRDLLDPRLKQ